MYGKIFSRLFTGSMYGAGSNVFAVMAYVIASMKPDGAVGFQVDLNLKDLSNRIGDRPERIQAAIDYLCQPDPLTTTPGSDGRRLIKVGTFAYQVVNGKHYNEIRHQEELREKNRIRVARFREKAAAPDAGGITPDQIYEAYPLKVGKPAAIRAINKAMTKIDPAKLLEITKAYALRRGSDKSFMPHPSTWFNQERYNDDPANWLNDTTSKPTSPDRNAGTLNAGRDIGPLKARVR